MSVSLMILSLLIFYYAAHRILKQPFQTLLISNLSIVLLISYLAAIVATFIHEGHPTDIACFKTWANMLFSEGLSQFYSSGTFTDYPPGYMYVLYVIGGIRAVFHIPDNSYTFVFLIKSPAIIANILTGIFIYMLAVKKTSERNALILTLLYTLNPCVLFNASVWGQVDAIHTLLLVVAVYNLSEKKLLGSMLIFVVSALVKPQSFMFAPLYMYVFYRELKGETRYTGGGETAAVSDRDAFLARLKALATYCLLCAALAVALMLPFAKRIGLRFDFKPVLQQYFNTLGSYHFGSVNAYNFFYLLGYNWKDASETTFLFLPLAFWGVLALILVVCCALYLLNRSKSKSNLFFVCAFINLTTFVFSIKMHERYAFPAMAFLLVAYLYRMDKKLLLLYIGTTTAILINCLDVFRATLMAYDWNAIAVSGRVFSLGTIAVFAYLVYVAASVYGTEDEADEAAEPPITAPDLLPFLRFRPKPFQIERTEKPARMRGADYFALCALTFVYTAIAFANLGNTQSPQTMWTMVGPGQLTVDFGQSHTVQRMQWLLGPNVGTEFSVAVSADQITWSEKQTVKTKSVFAWSELKINQIGRYLRLTVDQGELKLMELAFRDNANGLIPIDAADARQAALFDEQALVPQTGTYMNSTYFDEIYHGRTAYEFIRKLNVYEWTHPPLGKAIIAAGVSLFGMTPFGWRFAGTLFGVLMIPLLYVFAKRLFRHSYWAFFAAFVFAFDFMHFVQTRIATIDTYITFFIIAMYYFMYRYWQTSYYDKPLYKTLPALFFSGLFMGLGIAAKWPGVYAAAGLATLFFIVLYRRYTEYRFVKKQLTAPPPSGDSDGAAAVETISDHGAILKQFRRNTLVTLLCCVVFFVVIPLLIYFLSYIPYYATGSLYPDRSSIRFLRDWAWTQQLLPDNSFGNYIAAVIQNQFDIFKYHANLESTHDFASPWWSWPIIGRPIFYYAHSYSNTIKAGISSFGNPAVWWTGVAALVYGAGKLVLTKDKKLLFLIIAFFAQFVFWIPISRTTYIYHYFPSTPFLVLLIAYFFRDVMKHRSVWFKNPFQSGLRGAAAGFRVKAATVYLTVVGLMFVLYYPVLTGIPVYAPYVKYVLRLFIPTWVFISY